MDWESLAVVSSVFLFGFLENLFPFFNFKETFQSKTDTNLILGIVNLTVGSLTTALLLNWVWQQTIWQGFFHWIKSPWLGIVLSFLLLDAYMYIWHRWMHTIPIAWHFHQVHHTEMLMNTSTAYRFHPVEAIASNIPKLFLVLLFGITPRYLLFYETLLAIELIFHHSNWAIQDQIDNFLSYIIVTPNCHRAHHSESLKESQSNYGSFLSIWDRLFNSFYYPKYPDKIKLGLHQYNQKLNSISLLMLPFAKKL